MDTAKPTPGSFLAGAAYILSVGVLGAMLGALGARFTMPAGGMGWDDLAHVLGGLMIGGAAGLVLGAVTVRWLRPMGRVLASALALVAAIVTVLAMQVMPPPARVAGPQVVLPPPPVESFSLTLGTADPLEGPARAASGAPWRVLRVGSNLSYDFVLAARPSELCLVVDGFDTPDGVARFTRLRSALAALPATIACGAPCPTCPDVSLEWSLDQDRRTLTVSDQCWSGHADLAPVREAIAAITGPAPAKVSCEKIQ